MQPLWETVWRFLKKNQKSNCHIILCVCVCVYEYKAHLEERYLHIHSHCNIIHDSQEVKVSLIRWMDKENVVYTLDGILYSIKQERNTVTYTIWMNFENINLSEVSQSQKAKHYIISCTWSIWSSQNHKNRKWKGACLVWDEGKDGKGNLCLVDIDFQFCKVKKFSRPVAQLCE